ncbi:hypothetical protein L227DRAFT_360067 [Lentinus tigrinus ALCF2SS1-6]|uniref:Uncharacterized protein n=1 Tax=Lentinus tigrinus ALCF2SS1-6 TaxID=1328759 RepID=A0A5C2SJ13_9APHY|nr:hypothetical protein L227DRAFT_360067 [Lentinus tigrinus ALCF2SS1-6]
MCIRQRLGRSLDLISSADSTEGRGETCWQGSSMHYPAAARREMVSYIQRSYLSMTVGDRSLWLWDEMQDCPRASKNTTSKSGYHLLESALLAVFDHVAQILFAVVLSYTFSFRMGSQPTRLFILQRSSLGRLYPIRYH